MPTRKAGFADPLILEKVGERQWLVKESLRFYSAKLRRTFRVPSGTPTDLASIPRPFWVVFPKEGKQDRAAALHDAGYNHYLVDIVGYPLQLSKKTVDDLFYEAMLSDGVGEKAAWTMWKAVRLFGRMKAKQTIT